jgi:hypothetical protein
MEVVFRSRRQSCLELLVKHIPQVLAAFYIPLRDQLGYITVRSQSHSVTTSVSCSEMRQLVYATVCILHLTHFVGHVVIRHLA